MADEINGEVEQKKEEKKDNWFSKTFSKAKKAIEDTNRESKLESEYKKVAIDLYVYTGSLLPNVFSGKLKDDNTVEVYGIIKNEDIPYSSILEIKKDDNSKFYYITELRHYEDDKVDLTITEKMNDQEVKNTYSRPVTYFTINSDVKEVKVIKVKDRYFLKLDKKAD